MVELFATLCYDVANNFLEVLTMKIKLFDGSHKKIESAVNEFIAQQDIKVIEIKLKVSVNGTVVMVVYE